MNDRGDQKTVFMEGFRAWKKEHNQNTGEAITRYVMSIFLDELNRLFPDDYVLKGGNLLWHYIKTARPTKDLDLTTISKSEADIVLEDISKVQGNGVRYSVFKHQVKTSNMHVGLMLRIQYETDSKQTGIFGIDCVLSSPTDIARIVFLKREISAASIENIIIDKLHACHRFGDDNTRMKDYDDLYRIATDRGPKIREDVLKDLSEIRQVALNINPRIADALAPHWNKYRAEAKYAGAERLPKSIHKVIEITNKFLKSL